MDTSLGWYTFEVRLPLYDAGGVDRQAVSPTREGKKLGAATGGSAPAGAVVGGSAGAGGSAADQRSAQPARGGGAGDAVLN